MVPVRQRDQHPMLPGRQGGVPRVGKHQHREFPPYRHPLPENDTNREENDLDRTSSGIVTPLERRQDRSRARDRTGQLCRHRRNNDALHPAAPSKDYEKDPARGCRRGRAQGAQPGHGRD